jgi:branched-chain amino acid transport system permease protein/urea transport system permease protein
MEQLVAIALSTFSLFGFYCLLAVSLGLIFGQLGVVNVAHGELVMVGAFVMYAFADVPFVLRVLIALVVGLLLGAVIERLVLSGLYDRGFLATLLAMWGVAIVLRQGADAIFGSTPSSVAEPITGSVSVLGVSYPLYRIVAAAASLAITAVLLLVLYRTSIGLKIRATVDNQDMASVLGISPRSMMTVGFAVGAAVAVLAGALQSPVLGVTPSVGTTFLAPAFFALLVGRPGNLRGAVFGAFVVALLSTVLRSFLSETAAQFALFSLLIVLIAVAPNGLMLRRPSWLTRPTPSASTPARAAAASA